MRATRLVDGSSGVDKDAVLQLQEHLATITPEQWTFLVERSERLLHDPEVRRAEDISYRAKFSAADRSWFTKRWMAWRADPRNQALDMRPRYNEGASGDLATEFMHCVANASRTEPWAVEVILRPLVQDLGMDLSDCLPPHVWDIVQAGPPSGQ